MSAFSFFRERVQNAASRYGYQVARKYECGEFRLDVLKLLLEIRSPRNPEFFFIQVGANDGRTNDPIYESIRKYDWRGVLLEPQPDAFRQLRDNYKGSEGLSFENAALAPADGHMPFWTVPGQTRLGSFDRQVLFRSGFGNSQIAETKVATISAATLIDRYQVKHLDLLQVDAEGFDYEIVKMMTGTGIRPAIINYEHNHLSTADRDACVRLLGGMGYKLLQVGDQKRDTIAVYHKP